MYVNNTFVFHNEGLFMYTRSLIHDTSMCVLHVSEYVCHPFIQIYGCSFNILLNESISVLDFRKFFPIIIKILTNMSKVWPSLIPSVEKFLSHEKVMSKFNYQKKVEHLP